MTGNEIRMAFLRFFAERGHTVLPSSSLVPEDPTTLFTTAGMQQFVPWFRREVDPPYGSVATVQKCARTDDLDQVGRTARHHTFFEMLGNFSFGDYFKEETLRWGWEFTTLPRVQGGLGLDPARVWVTYYKPKVGEPYQEDLEARQIWLTIGVPAERIVPLGKKENWWGPVGDTGPCGPCSEMHYDRGAHLACGPECTSPACGCDRWIEFWNHVFQQFNYQDGQYQPLPAPGIDTGAGLERIASLVADVPTNYDTDLVQQLMVATLAQAGMTAAGNDEQMLALRVIADHLRCVAFMIADGVLPSNNKRGYVVRRIIRRAYRFGRVLGLTSPFLYTLVPTLVEMMGGHYHELADNARFIADTLRAEEARFAETLERGEETLSRTIEQTKTEAELKDTLQIIAQESDFPKAATALEQLISKSGIAQAREASRKLLERIEVHGLAPLVEPMDKIVHDLARVTGPLQHMTEEIGKSLHQAFAPLQQQMAEMAERLSKVRIDLSGVDVFTLYDTYGFPRELTEETAREAGLRIDEAGFEAAFAAARERARAGGKFAYEASVVLGPEVPATEFVGYQTLAIEATLVHFEADDARTTALVVLDKTPFYATSGGQCTDRGALQFGTTALPIIDVTKDKFGHALHSVDLTAHPEFAPGPHHTVTARVDGARRNAIRRAHTATHLLHWALHHVLGEHAKQAGSLVDEDVLRFDFSHPQAMTPAELRRVEDLVYGKILTDAPVAIRDMSLAEARKEGYTALFGEKYGDWVRTVNIGDGEFDVAFSRELCGGTHLDRTGQAGFFVIIGESSVAAGIRRIEALTGLKAVAWVREQAGIVRDLSGALKAAPGEILERVDGLQREIRDAQQRINELKVKAAAGGEGVGAQVEEIGGTKAIVAALDGVDAATIATLADQYLNKLGSGVVVLASVFEGKVFFAVKVSKDLTGRYQAGTIVREVAKVAGGGGGGRPDFAQAGGRDPGKLPDALAKARALLAE